MSQFRVGLTGGIGSGKTAATDYLQSLDVAVVDTDLVARLVVEPGRPAWQEIREYFGEQALLADQSLNRAWLRQHVFEQPERRKWLESVIHPRVREEVSLQLDSATSVYAILASPLLFESGQHMMVDRTLVIDVSTELQLERASRRDGSDPETIQRIIDAQIARPERCAKADDIAPNTGTLDELYQHLDRLHQQYIQLAQR